MTIITNSFLIGLMLGIVIGAFGVLILSVLFNVGNENQQKLIHTRAEDEHETMIYGREENYGRDDNDKS